MPAIFGSKLRKDENGATAVSVALTLVALLMIICAIIDVGLLFINTHSMEAAASDAMIAARTAPAGTRMSTATAAAETTRANAIMVRFSDEHSLVMACSTTIESLPDGDGTDCESISARYGMIGVIRRHHFFTPLIDRMVTNAVELKAWSTVIFEG